MVTFTVSFQGTKQVFGLDWSGSIAYLRLSLLACFRFTIEGSHVNRRT